MTKNQIRFGPLRVGIGGPVGAGKTSLTEALCRTLSQEISMAVITNDIYTREDANYLVNAQALTSDRIYGVETGGCPHTAIREDASVNSPELVDLTIYVIDVCMGGDIPRKKGPALMKSDMLVVNKVELAKYVEVDLDQMRRDTKENRGNLPYIFGSMRDGTGVKELAEFLKSQGGLGLN